MGNTIMKLSKTKIKCIKTEILLQLYEWTLFLAIEEMNSDFHVLKSLQNSYVDLQMRRILQFDKAHQTEVLTAFVKSRYQDINSTKTKLSQHEQDLVKLIDNPYQIEIKNWDEDAIQNYKIHPDDLYCISKDTEYGQKKQLSPKKVTVRTLFSKLKKTLSKDKCLSLDISTGYVSSFNTEVTKNVKLVTFITAGSFYGNCYYSYYHDIYIHDNHLSLFLSYPSLIGFIPNWFIYHEDDIEVALNIIWNCCEQLIPKISEVVNNFEF
jgi:hypothetical protein